jgi:hypothetical protein
MTRTVTVGLPEEIYDRLRQSAQATNKPVEELVVQSVKAGMPGPLPNLISHARRRRDRIGRRRPDRADISLVTVRWLGEERDAEVLISEGNDSLIGTELLRATQLTIDYAACTVSSTKPVKSSPKLKQLFGDKPLD